MNKAIFYLEDNIKFNEEYHKLNAYVFRCGEYFKDTSFIEQPSEFIDEKIRKAIALLLSTTNYRIDLSSLVCTNYRAIELIREYIEDLQSQKQA